MLTLWKIRLWVNQTKKFSSSNQGPTCLSFEIIYIYIIYGLKN
jgi:hypothetical protein